MAGLTRVSRDRTWLRCSHGRIQPAGSPSGAATRGAETPCGLRRALKAVSPSTPGPPAPQGPNVVSTAFAAPAPGTPLPYGSEMPGSRLELHLVNDPHPVVGV